MQWVHFHPIYISQVSFLTATLVYHFYNISRSGFAAEAAELLQTHNGQGHVDVSRLAAREQVRDRKEMNESCRKMVDKHNKHDRNFQSQFPTITNVQHSRRGYECEDFRRLMHRFLKMFLCLSAVCSQYARHPPLPANSEVGGRTGVPQDSRHLCCTPHCHVIQPLLANGQFTLQQHHSFCECIFRVRGKGIENGLYCLSQISGLILMVALSSMGTLLFGQRSWSFSSFPQSFQTLLYHHWGPKAAGGPHSPWSDFTHSAFFSLPFTLLLVWTALVHMSHTAFFSLFFSMLFSTVCLKQQKLF